MIGKVTKFSEQAAKLRASSKRPEPLDYVAFESGTDPTCLRIEFERDWVHAPTYRFLQDVYCNGERGTQVILLFTFMVVTIRGRNLAGIADGIADRTVSAIRKFDTHCKAQQDPSLPFIEQIEFTPDDEIPSMF